MKIKIIAVGKLQKDYSNLYDKYSKKINQFDSLELIEIKESKHSNMETRISQETNMIISKLTKGSKNILCSLNGKTLDSVGFAKEINSPSVTFIIGGSDGVDESKFDNLKIKFSQMTFPHQLFRIFLIEQIYRGISINKNMKYHK